jgi:catechol 2,3-dioxygenase-like lactoylglutathione lyase family enzyme
MKVENQQFVSKFTHIEIVHDDPRAAAEFMQNVFGAVQVEKKLSDWLANKFNIECIHMMFGGIVYQLVKPNQTDKPGRYISSWEKVLNNEGPAVHNITIQVNDLEQFREKMLEQGAKEVHAWKKGIDFKAAGFDVEGGPKDAYFFDAIRQCGLRIEFLETLPEWEPGKQE